MRNNYTGRVSTKDAPFLEFAKYLEMLMDRKGLTTNNLVEETGQTYEACRRWVRGMVLPDRATVTPDRLARLLGVTPEEFRYRISVSKLMKEYGDLVTGLVSSLHGDKHFQKIVALWPQLEVKEREHAVAAVLQLLGRRRKTASSGS